MAVEYLVNADFDLSLRRRQLDDRRARRQRVRETGLTWLIGLEPGDSVRLEDDPSPDFAAQLEGWGLPAPRVTLAPAVRAAARPEPFGWNAEVAEVVGRYRSPPPHPALDVVRRVNGRRFAVAVERELEIDDGVVGWADTVAATLELIARAAGGPVMLKAEHGNAGLGNRRVLGPHLDAATAAWLERTLAEDEAVVVERWRPRLLDLCAVFEVGPTAMTRAAAVHEVVNTAAGAFIGALYDPGGQGVGAWREELDAAVELVAARLADAGYFGPTAVDAFVWVDGDGRPRLRPLVDLNARRHASEPAARLWQGWCPDRVLYWRLFARRRLTRLPSSMAAVVQALGDDRLDSRARTGTLLASPLQAGGREASRVAVAFVASTRGEVFALEARFRERFEP